MKRSANHVGANVCSLMGLLANSAVPWRSKGKMPFCYCGPAKMPECIFKRGEAKTPGLDVVAVPWWRFDTPPHGCCSEKTQLCSSPCSSWRSQTQPRLAAGRRWLAEAGTRSASPERRCLLEPQHAELGIKCYKKLRTVPFSARNEMDWSIPPPSVPM